MKILVIFLLLVGSALAQHWSSVATITGETAVDGYKITADATGNTYVIGRFSKSIMLDSITLHGGDQENVYVAKYNRFHRVVWAQVYATVLGGAGNLVDVYGLAIGPSGSVYIAGNYIGTVVLGGSNHTSVAPTEIYLAKFSADGSWKWLKTCGQHGNGTFNQNAAYAICVDNAENCYITGTFNDSATFDTITISSPQPHEVYIAKYDSEGNALWARGGGGDFGQHTGLAVATDHEGNAYLSGVFFGNVTFGSDTLHAIDAEQKMFLCKYGADGSLKWSEKIGTGGYYGFAEDIAFDTDNNPYVAGYFRATIDFGSFQYTNNSSAQYAALVMKFDPNGKIIWATKTDGPNQAAGAYGISVDKNNRCYIIGSISKTTSFGDTTFSLGAGKTAFVAQLDESGKFTWVKTVGGSGTSTGNGFVKTSDGEFEVIGQFTGSVSFDAMPIVSTGNSGVFIASLSLITNEVTDPRSKEEVLLYPNPAHSKLHFTKTGTHILTDLLGRTVKQTTEAEMDVSAIAAGSYYCDGELIIIAH